VCEAAARWARSLGAMVRLEPPRLDRVDNKRPDLEIYIANKHYLLDVSIVHPSAASYKKAASSKHLATAPQAERRKSSKYRDLAAASHAEFFPFVVESLVVLVRKLLSLFSPLCVRPRVPIWRGASMRLCMVCRAMLPLLSSVGMR
jgi:hypothetical protein